MRTFTLGRWLIGGIVVLLVASGGQSVRAQEAASTLQERADALADRGDSLRKDRQFEAAMDEYEDARALYRRLGNRGGEAKMTEEIGILFAYRHQYEKALTILEQAAEGHRKAGDEEALAKNLNNIAILYRRQGQYQKALDRYQEVLALYDEKERSDRAFVLNNLGLVYEDIGQYSKALRRFREALEIQRALDDREGRATSLDNIADVLEQQGRYEEALDRYREALERYRALEKDVRIANTLNGIGNIHFQRGRYDQAFDRYREALEMYRDLEDRSRMADILNNVGATHREQGRYQKAMEALQEALQIHREVGRPGSVAISLNEIGSVYRARGGYEEARARYEEALQINRKLGRTADEATSLHRMGQLELEVGRYAAADSLLYESIRLTEALFETASGADRRDFLAREMDRFHTLVTTRVRAGRPAAALRTYERSRARLLTERLENEKGDSTRAVPSVEELRRALGPEEAAVLYANTGTSRPVTVFVVTRTDVKAQEIKTDSLLQRAGDRYKEAFGRLRTFEKMPGTPTRPDLLRRAKGVELEVGTEHQLAELVRLYRHELSMPREYSVLSTARRETLGQFLYSALLDPIEEELRGAGELIFVPDGVMSYLPLEALSDWDHTRVIEKWRVRYVQSLRVLRLLQERHQSTAGADRRSLLAFGDAVYDPTSYITDTSGFGAGTTLIAGRNVPEELAASPASSLRPGNEHRPGNDSTDLAAYWERGYGPDRWHNLPNTLDEVRSLSRIATSSTVMIGEGAREQAMWTLSRSGALAEYRAVHIAAHGFVVPERPGLSALVFSEVGTHRQADRERLEQTIRNRQSGADGYLSMREIAQLNLRADFVGLSACQTGLGRIYRGSGAVSLAHGFLRAGAGSVAVSLWSVDDTSTHHFMEAVYQRAWNRKGASWSEAIARTKRRFAVGDHGERLQSPRFWAPFVYYGWEPRPTSP